MAAHKVSLIEAAQICKDKPLTIPNIRKDIDSDAIPYVLFHCGMKLGDPNRDLVYIMKNFSEFGRRYVEKQKLSNIRNPSQEHLMSTLFDDTSFFIKVVVRMTNGDTYEADNATLKGAIKILVQKITISNTELSVAIAKIAVAYILLGHSDPSAFKPLFADSNSLQSTLGIDPGLHYRPITLEEVSNTPVLLAFISNTDRESLKTKIDRAIKKKLKKNAKALEKQNKKKNAPNAQNGMSFSTAASAILMAP